MKNTLTIFLFTVVNLGANAIASPVMDPVDVTNIQTINYGSGSKTQVQVVTFDDKANGVLCYVTREVGNYSSKGLANTLNAISCVKK